MNRNLSEVQMRPLREVTGMKSGDAGGIVRDFPMHYVDDLKRRDADYHDKDGEEMRRQRALTEDIRRNGMQSPVTVREWPMSSFGPGGHELQDGHHRVMAAMELGLKEIPVQVEQYGRRRKTPLTTPAERWQQRNNA